MSIDDTLPNEPSHKYLSLGNKDEKKYLVFGGILYEKDKNKEYRPIHCDYTDCRDLPPHNKRCYQ